MSSSKSSSNTIYKGVNLGEPLTPDDLSYSARYARLPLILGSGSSTRKLICDSMQLDYTVLVKEIDERGLGVDLRSRGTLDDARALVGMLASAKRDAVVGSLDDGGGGTVVLTGDQVVTHPELGILEKPLTLDEASDFLSAYRSTPTVTTVGSVLCTHHPSGIEALEVFEATVTFDKDMMERDEEDRKMGRGDGMLKELIDANAPILKCAGGLMIENPIVKKFITSVMGGEDAVLGLSRRSVLKALKKVDSQMK